MNMEYFDLTEEDSTMAGELGDGFPSTRRIEWQNGVFDRSAETAFHTTSSFLEACLEHSKHHNLSREYCVVLVTEGVSDCK
jgi:hypothetical protein